MESPARIVADRLAREAEAVCRHYLGNGRREGHYWLVGNIRNAPGRSLFVRLAADADGAPAGKWTDAANGDHGDLLDVIAAALGQPGFAATLAEARRFLGLPPSAAPHSVERARTGRTAPAARERRDAARRLWNAARPLAASPAAAYLAARAITDLADCPSLRFHPSCHYRADTANPRRASHPALIAAVSAGSGEVTGIQRTYLAPGANGPDHWCKAPLTDARKAMGQLLGNGVRFGEAGSVMALGEGIETVLSLRQVLPGLPMIAGLSAAHMAAIALPASLARLYVALDRDAAGVHALERLRARCRPELEIITLWPLRGDFNEDLVELGRHAFSLRLRGQLQEPDRDRLA